MLYKVSVFNENPTREGTYIDRIIVSGNSLGYKEIISNRSIRVLKQEDGFYHTNIKKVISDIENHGISFMIKASDLDTTHVATLDDIEEYYSEYDKSNFKATIDYYDKEMSHEKTMKKYMKRGKSL